MFEWDEKKSLEIKKRHGFSFKDIAEALEVDFVVIDTPSKSRSQKAFLVFINNYPIVVPFEKRGTKFRLITAWPDRRFK